MIQPTGPFAHLSLFYQHVGKAKFQNAFERAKYQTRCFRIEWKSARLKSKQRNNGNDKRVAAFMSA